MDTDLFQELTVAIAKTSPQSALQPAKKSKRRQGTATAYDFSVQISSGSLAGKTFEGFFSYDGSGLSGEGFETVGVSQGLKISFNFLNNQYTEADDVRFPGSPSLQFKDGELCGLKYAPFDFIFYLSSQPDVKSESFTYDISTGSGEGQVVYARQEIPAALAPNSSAQTKFGLSTLSWLLRKKAVSAQKA